jgi:hypothetical protein
MGSVNRKLETLPFQLFNSIVDLRMLTNGERIFHHYIVLME